MADLELLKLNRTLKESEASYKGLFDSVAEAIYIQDRDGKFLDVNPGAVKMYGYPREWFIGKSPLDVSAPGKNDLAKIKAAVDRAFAGEPQEFEFWGERKSGEAFPKDVRLYKGTYFGKDVVIALATDITFRKKAEAELAKSNLQLRSVYDQTSDILYYMTVERDGSYRFTSVNPSFYKATGLKQDQVIGKLVTEVIPEPSLSLVLSKYKAAIEEKKAIAWEEVTPYPTGTKYGDVSVAPIFDDKGRCANLIGTVHDVTDRKRAEEELAKANKTVEEALRVMSNEKAKLATVLNGIADGVFVIDDHGKIILFNQAAGKITGLSFDTIKGKQYWEVLSFVPEGLSEAKADFIRSALAGKEQELEVNLTFRKTSGKVIPIQASAAALDGRGKPSLGIVVIFRDISKAREIQQLRDEFMMIVSHELRAPMTAIKWLVSMMLEGSYGSVAENLKFPLTTIVSSTDRLIHLVNDMINTTRVEAGDMRLALTNIDIKKTIDDLLITFGSEAKKNNIQIDAVGVESVMIQADSDWTAQILSNLIDNAIKFNHEGGKITISAKKDNDFLNVAIADTGIGIPDDFKEKLFTKFAQVLSKKAGKSIGMGLGLFISRELVRGFGGDLWLAETKIEAGSTFVIKIPLTGSPTADITLANHKKKTG